MNTHTLPVKTVASATAISLALAAPLATPLAFAGDLNAEMNQMFNDLGSVGNYTAPGAFKGQIYNTYTGGNLFIRTPNKTYQLAAVQFPNAKGGCGGIDLFGGSFSHLSAAEFRDVLKKITAALPGIAFQLAVESVSPLLGGVTKWAKGLETTINNARINSCQTATALVASAAEATGFSSQDACAKLAMEMGLESDIDSAMRRCASDSPSILGQARASLDPNIANRAPFVGNLTWQALKSVTSLDDPARELVMSIVGTVIFLPPEAGRDPDVIGPSITSVNNLLYGQGDAGGGDIYVQMLKCNNYDSCDSVTRIDNFRHTPLTTQVETLLKSISTSIQGRTAIPNNTAAVGLVNSSSLPLWRMLSVGNSIPGSTLGQILISDYKDVIAADYAYAFLNQFTNVALAALLKKYRLLAIQQKDADVIRADAQRFLDRLGQEKLNLYRKVQSVNTIVAGFESIERTMRTNFGPDVMANLAMSTRLKGY